MSKFYKRIKKGLEDVLAHKEGEIILKTEVFEIPEPPVKYMLKSIQKIRKRGRLSQNIFEKEFN